MDNMDNIDNIINQLNDNLDLILDYNNNLNKNTTNLLDILNEQPKKTKKISPELAKFMDINETDYVNEIDVLKKIYKYVLKSNLYNEKNVRYFRSDKILETILDSLEEDEKEKGYNYFNVQKYFMKNYL